MNNIPDINDIQEYVNNIPISIINSNDINLEDNNKVLDQLHHIRLSVDERYKLECKEKEIKEYYQSIIMTELWYRLAKEYVSQLNEYKYRISTLLDSYKYEVYLDMHYLFNLHPGDFEEFCFKRK